MQNSAEHLIYAHICCLNRPLDDLAQSRVRLEAEAMMVILEKCESQNWTLLDSDAIRFEINRNQDLFRKEQLKQILAEYPEPPDFIANRPPTVKLTRSIPQANKQLLKEWLGFPGYKLGEFTPNHTRRATALNWLLSCLVSHNLPLV